MQEGFQVAELIIRQTQWSDALIHQPEGRPSHIIMRQNLLERGEGAIVKVRSSKAYIPQWGDFKKVSIRTQTSETGSS